MSRKNSSRGVFMSIFYDAKNGSLKLPQEAGLQEKLIC